MALDVTDGAVRNSDGALAGSALTLSAAIANAVELGIDPVEALRAVTSAPAALIGRDDVGVLRPGVARRRRRCSTTTWSCARRTWAAYPSHEPAHLRDRRAARGAGPAARRQLPRLDAWRTALRRGEIDGVVVVARGSSDNAARYAQYLWSLRTGLPVALATPSLHTVYGGRIDVRGKAVVALSQSGASPDVVAVLAAARDQGVPAVAITNDPDSPLARAATDVLDLAAGAERSVAATKTYTASVLAVAVLGLALGDPADDAARLAELAEVPDAVAAAIEGTGGIDAAAEVLAASMRGVVVGRGLNLGTAFEAALKLTELDGVADGAVLARRPLARSGRRGGSGRPGARGGTGRTGHGQRAGPGPGGGAARLPGRDDRADRRPRPGRHARPAAARGAGRSLADSAAGRRPGPAPRPAGRRGQGHRRGPSRRSDEGDSHDLIAGTPGVARSFY